MPKLGPDGDSDLILRDKDEFSRDQAQINAIKTHRRLNRVQRNPDSNPFASSRTSTTVCELLCVVVMEIA